MPFQIPLKPTQMALFGLLVFFCACNTSSDKEKAAKSQETVADTTAPKPPEDVLHIRGNFDTLYTYADTVLKLDSSKRMVFCYTFKKGQGSNKDSLTMHGWPNKQLTGDEVFDPKPKVVLLNGNPGPYEYSPGTYFENLVIRPKSLDRILDTIRIKGAIYVLFAPTPDPNYAGHIIYKIFVTKDHPFAPLKNFAPIPTDQIANPSPPRNR